MISGKKRAISYNEIAHYVRTLLYNLQFVVAHQHRILKSKNRAIFLNFADISNMRKKRLISLISGIAAILRLKKILHLIKQTLTWEKVDGIFERSAVEYLEKPRLLQWY